MSNFKYGDSWEKFPIEAGEVWGLDDGSRVAVHDIFNPLPSWMKADLVFVDPPWNTGNLKSFYTKADMACSSDFTMFTETIFRTLAEIEAKTVYIEMGNQAVEVYRDALEKRFPCVQQWGVTYYRKHPTNILRASDAPINYDFTGIDEAKCIEIVTQIEDYKIIADPCMGRGLVALAANKSNKVFVGTELNKRRLAVLLDKLAKKGETPHIISQNAVNVEKRE
jgi:hypothetical protein